MTDRMDAGHRLQTQLALETNHHSRQWRQCQSWIFDARQQNEHFGLIWFAASRSFCQVFQFLQIKSLGSQWFVLKLTNSNWVWSIHQLSTVFCLKIWREVEYCWIYLAFCFCPVGWVISCAGLKAIWSWCSYIRRCIAAGFCSTRTTTKINGSCSAQLSGYALELVDSFECLGRK
jgi:hypothetical protein